MVFISRVVKSTTLVLMFGMALVIRLYDLTDFEELKRQPALREQLVTYPVYALGESYIIVQLHEKK